MRLTINTFGEQDPPNLRDEEEDLFVGYDTLRKLDMIKEKHGKSSDSIFFDFVMLNRQRFGKEPVDRIYAAFGMTKGTDGVYRKGILIDYSEDAKNSYWKLYATFGQIASQHEPHLRLLSMVSSKERPDQLPSWCPNWNSTRVTGDIDSTNVYAAGWPWREHRKARWQQGLRFSALRRTSSSISLSFPFSLCWIYLAISSLCSFLSSTISSRFFPILTTASYAAQEAHEAPYRFKATLPSLLAPFMWVSFATFLSSRLLYSLQKCTLRGDCRAQIYRKERISYVGCFCSSFG